MRQVINTQTYLQAHHVFGDATCPAIRQTIKKILSTSCGRLWWRLSLQTKLFSKAI